jgi:hypothetical protein
MNKESGGRHYDKSGNLLTSNKGAQGEMQVMPATARDPGFGIKPAQSDDPNELRRVGDEYASVLLRRYRDPKLAMIAYNMGPGATDKWLASGADPRRLPRETQGYISGVNLAGGGEVKHYAGTTDGSLVEDEPSSAFERFFNQKSALKDYEEKLAKQRELERVTREQPGLFDRTTKLQRDKASADLAAASQARAGAPTKVVPPTIPAELKNVPIGNNVPTNQELKDFDQAAALFQAENMGRNAPVQAQATPKSQFELFMEDLTARRAENKAQRADDKNMALLTAGLGMLGGTSPYAMANIGQGALAGVQSLSESKKQRAAEQAALDKSMLYATRYQGAEELNKQNAAYNRAMKQQQYELDVKKYGTEQQKIAINQYETHINNAMKSLDKNTFLSADPAARAAAEDKILRGDTANRLYRRAYGEDPAGETKSNTIKFDARGKQIAG